MRNEREEMTFRISRWAKSFIFLRAWREVLTNTSLSSISLGEDSRLCIVIKEPFHAIAAIGDQPVWASCSFFSHGELVKMRNLQTVKPAWSVNSSRNRPDDQAQRGVTKSRRSTSPSQQDCDQILESNETRE